MKITYIFRHPTKERSIERVFEPIMSRMKEMGHDVEVCFAYASRFFPWSLVKNMLYFALRSRNEICHITGDVQYVACFMKSKNTILTIHDLVSFHNKQTPWLMRKLVYWLWYYVPLKRLKYITCISDMTRRDLISYFPWAHDKICVINNPISDGFYRVPMPVSNIMPTILHVGTRSNKNLLRVIEAMKGVDATLRVIGKLDSDQELALKTSGINYSNVYHLSDQAIVREYESCNIVSFPSLFEGFGMPIIEAQAIGRPVLTSNLEPMKSVAGGACVLVDPESVEEIRAGFIELLTNDELQHQCIVKGYKNVESYTSATIVDSYYNLYIKMQVDK